MPPDQSVQVEETQRQRSSFRKPILEDMSFQNFDIQDLQEELASEHSEQGPSCHEWSDRDTVPHLIEEGQVWIRRHPASGLPSGFQEWAPAQPSQKPTSPVSIRPPFHPFLSFLDFDQARILIKNGASDSHITEQLQHNAQRSAGLGSRVQGPQSAKELHKLLAQAATAESLTFHAHSMVTEYKGHTYTHQVRSRSLWRVLRELLQDPDLQPHIVYLPEQRFVRSSRSGKPVQTLEEFWHGRDWWDAQRTYEGTMEVHKRAEAAKTATQAKKIRQEQSLRITQSSFLLIMGSDFTVYDAIALSDPLHQIEQGIFGKHMWPKLIDIMSQTNRTILDQRFKNVPAYPDLKHFPNGVTSLKYIEGHEHATILRLLAPLIEDLLPEEYKKITLKAIRALACIHLLSKMTTHSDDTLELLDKKIIEFGALWEKFSSQFDSSEAESDVSAHFPKLHSLSHMVDSIQRKSSTDNYQTGLGEGQHPQSKKDFQNTNHRPGFEDQMLRLYREQHTIQRIEAEIKRRTETEDTNNSFTNDSSSPRVQIGSKQRRMLTTTFVATLSHPSQVFQHLLQTFLYENVLGHAATRLPSARRLPSLQGTNVVPHRLLRVGYISLLDSTDGTDVMRVTPNWFGTGARHDFAVVQDDGSEEPWFARLLEVMALTFNGVVYQIAYVQRFRTRSHRSKLTGYIELQDRD
ncbi:hypothetical protein FRC06_003207, partial [Ceratobasidium sp. 370]